MLVYSFVLSNCLYKRNLKIFCIQANKLLTNILRGSSIIWYILIRKVSILLNIFFFNFYKVYLIYTVIIGFYNSYFVFWFMHWY